MTTRTEQLEALSPLAASCGQACDLLDRLKAGQTIQPATLEVVLRELRKGSDRALQRLEPELPLAPYLDAVSEAIMQLRDADVPDQDRIRAERLAQRLILTMIQAARVG